MITQLAFETFLLGYKHGVYIFVSDACEACARYQQEISYIDNPFLFVVETPMVKQQAILEKLTGRSVFPQTVGFVDNQIKFARTGIEFEKQQTEILLPFLDTFPKEPLTEAEIEERIKKQRNRCLLTLYAFSKDIPEDKRKELVLHGASLNEFAIDISHVGEGLPDSERERLLEGQYHTCRLVVYKLKDKPSTLNDFEQRIVMGYAAVNREITFTVRDIEDL